MEKKLQIPTEILCYGLPDEIGIYLNYCKSLKFEDRPDYDYLRNLLIKLIGECANLYGINGDLLNFDWAFEDLDVIWRKYNNNQGNGTNRDNHNENDRNINLNDSEKVLINKYNSLGEKSPLFQKINNKIKRQLTEINETPDNEANATTYHRNHVFDKTSENNPSIANSSSDIESGSKKDISDNDKKSKKDNSDKDDSKSYSSSSQNTEKIEFSGIPDKTLIKDKLSQEEYDNIFNYMNHDTIDNVISTIVKKGKKNEKDNLINEERKSNQDDKEDRKSNSTQKLSSSNINISNNVPDKITVKEFEESKKSTSNIVEERLSEYPINFAGYPP